MILYLFYASIRHTSLFALHIKFILMNKSKKKYRILAAAMYKGKWGFINTQGKAIIPFKYEATDYFCRGIAPVKLSGKWGFINSEGEEIIPPQYEDCVVIHNEGDYGFCWSEYIQVKHNKKWGYIDLEGNTIIPFRYDECSAFVNRLAIVRIKNKKNVIDITGNTILTQWFENILISGNRIEKWHLFIVKQKGFYGVIHRSGKWIIPCMYELICRENNYFEVRKNRKWGLLNRDGKEIVPCIYEELFYYGNLMWVITLNDHSELFSLRRKIKKPTFKNYLKLTFSGQKLCEILQLEETVNFIYEEIHVTSERIIAKYCEKWGITDFDGNILLPFIYDEIWNGGAYWYAGIVTDCNAKWFIIDQDGNIIFPLPVTSSYSIELLNSENILLSRNGKYLLTDYSGRPLIPEEFDDIHTINKNLFAISKNGYWVLFDIHKGFLKDLKYSLIIPYLLHSEICLVKKKDKYGFINCRGKVIFPIKYEACCLFHPTHEINRGFYAGNDLIKYSDD